jgi:uncharacterized protein (UPF0335 family)
MVKRICSSAELVERVKKLEVERKRLQSEIRVASVRERTRGKIVVGAVALKAAGIDDRAENQAAFAAIVAGEARAEDIIIQAADAIRRRGVAPVSGSQA